MLYVSFSDKFVKWSIRDLKFSSPCAKVMGNLCTKISHIALITSDAHACVINISIIGGLRYIAGKLSICLSVRPHFLACRYPSSVSIDWNKTCLKSKLCLWGSQGLFLQAYRTHHSLTGVRKRLKFRQPLIIKHEAGGSSPTPYVFYFNWTFFHSAPSWRK